MSDVDLARRLEKPADLDAVRFAGPEGLVPVVAQDADAGIVLMVAWADREALERTLSSGRMHYWSRSRQALWTKGETSGNVQRLASLHLDCDGDTVLARVEPAGPACHTGRASCFGVGEAIVAGVPPESNLAGEPGRRHGEAGPSFLPTLWRVLRERARERPDGSYTVRLLDDPNLRTKKLGEETAELVAALSRSDPDQVREEAADLLYHLLVALLAQGVELEGVEQTLRARHGSWP